MDDLVCVHMQFVRPYVCAQVPQVIGRRSVEALSLALLGHMETMNLQPLGQIQ